MGAQNFNFSSKFFQNGEFASPKFVFLETNLAIKRKIFGQAKIQGRGQSAAFALPLPRRQ